ncbi:MAG: MBL fold metallo-hydrolase [Archaeoglobaceae archaeon]|nr:MBL fold metallo-hydrolase [Archaeoglobaceae archaeon]MCX8151489.1 MBL fold metallo-hydrolase [Archaeoglobaceae archaeon]MDW8014251.1 MBL fold metallo-hydrolase [Archaeoglobaceae archaeon]
MRIIYGSGYGKYPECNCILIEDRYLIDSGASFLKNLKVEVVLNSHWHEDHVTYNCIAKKVMIHGMDAEAISDRREFDRRYGFEGASHLFAKFEFKDVDDTFKGGDFLELGKVYVEIVHTPGHSAGHCCFILDDKILFLGDIDLTPFGPWYGCLDCSVNDFIKSIDKIKNLIKERIELRTIVPAHGKVLTREEALTRLEEYSKILFDRDKKIKEFVKSGEDPLGKGIIYKKLPEPKEIYLHFEKIMIEKHLSRI